MISGEPEESLTSEVEPEITELGDIEALKQVLVVEQAKAETNLANWQRQGRDWQVC